MVFSLFRRRSGPPGLATAAAAEAYFRHECDCSTVSLDAIFSKLGKPVDYDDWDLGRLVYTWKSRDRCVRIHTSSGALDAVVLMEPVNTPRFGPPIAVIWERH